MEGFKRRELKINGVKTVVHMAGDGPALVFWHGAGTAPGFEFARPWTKTHTVILPYHPGFGESGDGAGPHDFDSIQDFVLHYLDVFDALKLKKVSLVGQSFGGWMAATFASQNSHRLDKSVLVCPAGLKDPKHPMIDLMKLAPEEVPGYLVHDPKVFKTFPPQDDPVEAGVQQYRETSSFARLIWERPHDRKLPNWLHRIDVPTLLVWGKNDTLIPPGQAKTWAGLIPGAKVQTFAKAGHLVLHESKESCTAIQKFLTAGR